MILEYAIKNPPTIKQLLRLAKKNQLLQLGKLKQHRKTVEYVNMDNNNNNNNSNNDQSMMTIDGGSGGVATTTTAVAAAAEDDDMAVVSWNQMNANSNSTYIGGMEIAIHGKQSSNPYSKIESTSKRLSMTGGGGAAGGAGGGTGDSKTPTHIRNSESNLSLSMKGGSNFFGSFKG